MIFLNSASPAAALVFYLPGVCTHTDTEGNREGPESGIFLRIRVGVFCGMYHPKLTHFFRRRHKAWQNKKTQILFQTMVKTMNISQLKQADTSNKLTNAPLDL